MAVMAATVDVAAETGGGNQTIDLPTGFGTPKGYLVWATNAVTESTESTNLVWSYGMADASSEVCMASSSEDGSASSDTYREHVADAVILLHNGTTGATDGEANHVSFADEELVINWSNAPSAGVRLHFFVLGGSDLSLSVGNATALQPFDSTTDVNVGFDPDVVLFGGNSLSFPGTAARAYYGMFGGVVMDGLTQGCMGQFDQDNKPTTQTGTIALNDRVNFAWDNNDALHRWIDVTGSPTNGFQVTLRIKNTDLPFFYMALASSTNGLFVGNIASPSSGTGDKPTTGIGFKPQAVVIGAQLEQTINTLTTAVPEAAAMAMGLFDGTNENCHSIRTEDNSADADCDARWDGTALFLRDASGGTTEFDAAFTSFDTDGFTLDYTTNGQPGAQWIVFAVEENAPGAAEAPGLKRIAHRRKLARVLAM